MSGIISPMVTSTVNQQVSSYMIDTPVYEGPMDLLLQLIERSELDITSLSLALVTDQYLEYIHQLTDLAADEVSAFLVIATKLLQIKSEALLPRPPEREPGEENPGDALAKQLIAYKRYRDIAAILFQREIDGFRTYLRIAPPLKLEGNVDLTGVSIEDLAIAAQDIFANLDLSDTLKSVMPPSRVTIREKIYLITESLRNNPSVGFRSLITKGNSRLEIVVTFLALLELIKRHLVRVSQEGLFGDISLEISEGWDTLEEIDTEFGE